MAIESIDLAFDGAALIPFDERATIVVAMTPNHRVVSCDPTMLYAEPR